MKVYRVHAEVSETAFLKLTAEIRRRNRLEGRGKRKYPMWRIVEDLLNTLPEPELTAELLEEAEVQSAGR
jgi:hypothetical protein